MTANESAKAPSAAPFSTTMSARVAPSVAWIFGQREDQERNSDRDNAVAEGNDPFDTCLSFMCHLLTQPFVRSTSSVGNGKVPERARPGRDHIQRTSPSGSPSSSGTSSAAARARPWPYAGNRESSSAERRRRQMM